MAPPKDIARSYPKRGLTADVGFRSEPKFCGDGSTEFDGTSDFATATTYDGGGTETTMVYWFKANSTAGTTMPFANGGASNSRNQLQTLITTGTLRAADAPTNIPFSIDANRWYMLAIVGDSGGLKKAYLDGVDGGSPVAYGHSITATSLTLGARSTGPTQPFNGKLARFRIFNVELTQDQIRELYNNPGLDVPTGLTSSNLRRNYELETDFNDSGADSENATATGSPSFTVDRPQLPRGLDLARGAAQARVYTGRAVDFDGSADKIIAAHYNPSGDFLTTTAWVNADTLRGQGLIYNGSTGRNSFLFYMLSTGVLNFYWNDTTGDARITHQTPLKNGQWYHLAAVMDMSDPADHQVTFYIDGIAATGTRTASGFTGDNNYGIGLEYGSTGWFDGKIADCRIFDVELTQAQIRELYHNPEQVLPTGVSASNLRRYYPLSDYNDTGGTGGRYFQDMGADGEAAEDKGSASMSFAQPVPCPQLGLQQSATRLWHPGGSQGATATITAPGTTVSLSAWIFWDQARTSYAIHLGTVTSSTDSFHVRVNTSGQVSIYQGAEYLSGLTITEGGWNHIVVATRSDSPYWRCWLNNSEASSPAVANVTNITSTSCYLGMNNSSYGMGGIANDAAVWNIELGDSDVAALYNSGVQGMDVSTVQSANLLGWWKFDDLTTLKDYSGNGANATVTGTFNAASFPENASGSTIVGDFSMKRKGVSILNLTGPDDGTAIISAQEAVYPKAGAANGYTIGFCYRKIKDGTAMVWGNDGASLNNQFMCFQQTGPNLRFNLGDGSSRPSVNTSNITDSDWHHYTLTISYATTPAEVKIYVDGAVDHSSTQSITGPPTDIREMRLGEGLFDSQSPVGCFKFYQVALSSDEVKRLAFSDLRLIKGLDNE
jgi:hypothetical protein